MKYEHVEDRAALYALGALPDDERAAIDAHLRGCSTCSEAVGSAEDDVALIVSTEPQHGAPPTLAARIDRLVHPRSLEAVRRYRRPAWPYAAAIAAALLFGLLPSAYFWSENSTMHGAMLAQSNAMDRLASGSHRTAPFRPTSPSPPAEVMYALDGSWYVVVVRNPSKSLSVAWMHDGVHTMLGNAVPNGNIAMLYLPKSHRMDRLALMDGDRVVAEAALSWQSTVPSRHAGRSG
ncbi:MAG: zf-HC2 domain-containing protein [Candidatus Cybelea sp.]